MAFTFQNVAITYWVQSCHHRLLHKNLPHWWFMKLSNFNSHYVKKSFLNLMYPNEGVFYFSFFVHKIHNELRTIILYPYPNPRKPAYHLLEILKSVIREEIPVPIMCDSSISCFNECFFSNKVLSSNSRNQLRGQIKSSTKIITLGGGRKKKIE